ncbi:MAG: hypothetical protein ABI874_09430 [Chloroflexota bacterium]
MSKKRWLTIETVRGDPIRVGDKTLTPLARRIAVRFDVLGAQGGGGIEHVQPIDVVEEIDDVSRRIPIADVTGAALRSMLIGAIVVGGLTWLVRLFVSRKRSKP